MSPHKVPSHGNVPFAWEKKPGVSKETSQQKLITTKFLDLDHHDHDHHQGFALNLLPPPPRPDLRDRPRILRVPPPPGNITHRVLYRSFPAKGSIRNKQDDEDPFFVAFKECTKSGTVKRGNNNNNTNRSSTTSKKLVSGLRSFFAVEPCKSLESCAVRDGNLVRVSHMR